MKFLPPQRIRRDADFARRGIDQPLDHIGRLRPPGAAIGIDRHGVGEDAAHAHLARRDVVNARRHAGADERDERRIAGQIGAHVGDEVDIEREEAPVRHRARAWRW